MYRCTIEEANCILNQLNKSFVVVNMFTSIEWLSNHFSSLLS